MASINIGHTNGLSVRTVGGSVVMANEGHDYCEAVQERLDGITLLPCIVVCWPFVHAAVRPAIQRTVLSRTGVVALDAGQRRRAPIGTHCEVLIVSYCTVF